MFFLGSLPLVFANVIALIEGNLSSWPIRHWHSSKVFNRSGRLFLGERRDGEARLFWMVMRDSCEEGWWDEIVGRRDSETERVLGESVVWWGSSLPGLDHVVPCSAHNPPKLPPRSLKTRVVPNIWEHNSTTASHFGLRKVKRGKFRARPRFLSSTGSFPGNSLRVRSAGLLLQKRCLSEEGKTAKATTMASKLWQHF